MTDLSVIPFDPEFTQGARNAIDVCLRVRSGEKVTVIADEALSPNWRSAKSVITRSYSRSTRLVRYSTCRRRCWTTWNRAR